MQDIALLQEYTRTESEPAFAALGTRINAIVRGKPVPMEVVAMPFVPTRYFRG